MFANTFKGAGIRQPNFTSAVSFDHSGRNCQYFSERSGRIEVMRQHGNGNVLKTPVCRRNLICDDERGAQTQFIPLQYRRPGPIYGNFIGVAKVRNLSRSGHLSVARNPVEEDIQTVSCITRSSILIRPHRQRAPARLISRATSCSMVHGKEFTRAPGELCKASRA